MQWMSHGHSDSPQSFWPVASETTAFGLARYWSQYASSCERILEWSIGKGECQSDIAFASEMPGKSGTQVLLKAASSVGRIAATLSVADVSTNAPMLLSVK